MKTIAAFATIATALISSAASGQSNFTGATVNYSYLYPTNLNVYSSGGYVVGSGVEILNVAGDPAITLDISSNSLLVSFNRTSVWTNYRLQWMDPFRSSEWSERHHGRDHQLRVQLGLVQPVEHILHVEFDHRELGGAGIRSDHDLAARCHLCVGGARARGVGDDARGLWRDWLRAAPTSQVDAFGADHLIGGDRA